MFQRISNILHACYIRSRLLQLIANSLFPIHLIDDPDSSNPCDFIPAPGHSQGLVRRWRSNACLQENGVNRMR